MGNKINSQINQLRNINVTLKLDLDNCDVTDKHLVKMSEMLRPNRGCYELHLKQNWFTAEGLKHLGDALAVNKGLKRLYLGSNPQMGDQGCITLASALKRSTTLGVLDLAACGIGAGGAAALGQALSLNKSLHTLYLNENPNIGSEGIKELCEGLTENQRLKIVDVGNCNIGDMGCIAISEWVSQTSIVEQLYLRKNEITARGSTALANALATKNRSLKLLNLDYNQIGDEGARPFMLVIRENDKIEKIEFDDKSISDEWKQEFQTRLARKQA